MSETSIKIEEAWASVGRGEGDKGRCRELDDMSGLATAACFFPASAAGNNPRYFHG